MKISRTRTLSIPGLLIAGLLATTTATAGSPSSFIGTWSGVWKGKYHTGETTQLTISMTDDGKLKVDKRRDDADKTMGRYQLFMPPGTGRYPATLKGDALHLGVAKKTTFIVTVQSDGRLKLTHKRPGNRHHVMLSRLPD